MEMVHSLGEPVCIHLLYKSVLPPRLKIHLHTIASFRYWDNSVHVHECSPF